MTPRRRSPAKDGDSGECGHASAMHNPALRCEPIGYIRTSYKSKYGAPRQPATAAESTIGTITLNPGFNFEQALEEISGFEFVWIVFWFHENTGWKPKVLPPNSGRKRIGVFATRSPHRPNPIGLSLCRLKAVKGRVLTVENPDMLDGTPILDIKPYLPHAEAFPEARGGWIAAMNECSTPVYTVRFLPNASRTLIKVEREEGREIVSYVTGLLGRDPHPHPYRRIKTHTDGKAVIAVRRWRFFFRLTGSEVVVSRISKAME